MKGTDRKKGVDKLDNDRAGAVNAEGATRTADNRALVQDRTEGLVTDKDQLGLAMPTDEVVLVEADAEQIAATLAYLHAHPEFFVKVDVSPAPKVAAQENWSFYNRGVGQQVNEQVKQSVQTLERNFRLSVADPAGQVDQGGRGDLKLGDGPAIATDKFADQKKSEKAAAVPSS